MRRMTRFSLRALFIVMTLVCVALAIHVAVWRSAQRQKRVIEKLQAAGASVDYDYQFESALLLPGSYAPGSSWYWGMDSPQYQPYYPPEPPVPQWLVNYFGIDYFCSVRGVIIFRNKFPGDPPPEELAKIDRRNTELLAELGHLKRVEAVALDWTPPDGLACLRTMPRLRSVYFRDPVDARHLAHVAESVAGHVDLTGPVSNEQLGALAKSQNLRGIGMPLAACGEPTVFTNDGVKTLCGLTQLTSLAPASDHVSDASAPHIARLDNLVELRLRLPRMTSGLPETLAGKPLRTLYLSHMALDNAAFAAIGELKQLETLLIDSPTALGEPPSLDNFSQEDVGSYEWIQKHVVNAPQATIRLTPASLESLCKLTNLRRLRLDYALTTEEIRKLLASIPLKFLLVGNEFAESEGEAIVADYPQLELCYEKQGGLQQYFGADAIQ